MRTTALVSSIRRNKMGQTTILKRRQNKHLGQRYVQMINRTYRRSGTLWEGRYRSCLVQDEEYVLACYRYIELNPVRAGMVDHPADYCWSSYRVNGQGGQEERITAHQDYLRLGSDATAA